MNIGVNLIKHIVFEKECSMRQDYEEVTVQELEQDILAVTGDSVQAKAKSQAFAIYYRNVVIDSTRYQKGIITEDDLKYSRHIQWQHMKSHSKKLAENMAKVGRGKLPKNTAAHHIVSWNAMRAARSRMRLAAFGIDIDHEANGVYLPLHKAHVPLESIPDAYAHATIHTKKYYLNVEFLLDQSINKGLGHRGIIEALRQISDGLEDGEFPIHTKLSGTQV
ncbi:AHH domain-containing protein [Pseudoalteromonas sp. S558]|uniref:AHH domain-containing protein n=1 Tax=Pseudoalteromonas sp. S558 TaxID=2066515 RepID=UPI00207B9B1D|nr:AHH domain-containing protein [Pseudoalteromonas sp. S558]